MLILKVPSIETILVRCGQTYLDHHIISKNCSFVPVINGLPFDMAVDHLHYDSWAMLGIYPIISNPSRHSAAIAAVAVACH